MHIIEIKLAGSVEPGHCIPTVTAVIERALGDEYINIGIYWADGTEKEHDVRWDRPDDLWSVAVLLQKSLDGCKGTHSEIDDYYRILEHFTD